jgi:hypothetical protein
MKAMLTAWLILIQTRRLSEAIESLSNLKRLLVVYSRSPYHSLSLLIVSPSLKLLDGVVWCVGSKRMMVSPNSTVSPQSLRHKQICSALRGRMGVCEDPHCLELCRLRI